MHSKCMIKFFKNTFKKLKNQLHYFLKNHLISDFSKTISTKKNLKALFDTFLFTNHKTINFLVFQLMYLILNVCCLEWDNKLNFLFAR